MRPVFIVLINLLLLGCAQTKVDSFLDLSYQERYNFEKTIVWAPGLQLGTQQILESTLVESTDLDSVWQVHVCIYIENAPTDFSLY